MRNTVKRLQPKALDYDIVINGGGIVGAALAVDLLRKLKGQLKVAVIEPNMVKPLRFTRSIPDARVYALSPNSIRYLQTIDCWKDVYERSHAYTSMQIWESSGPGLVKFHSKGMKVEELGRICEDSTVQSAIYKSAKDNGYNIDFIHSHSISDVLFPSSEPYNNEPITIKLTGNSKDSDDSREVTTR
jgi:2-polyprenyl-6-methoxyphenol hydroxylase-like FAD-dependent oxidoreductase